MARKYVLTITQETFIINRFPTLSIVELIKEIIKEEKFEEMEELTLLIEELSKFKK